MEFIEVSAKTVDDALTEALIKLSATSDQVEYEVIEKGSTGFLGIGSKPAVIKIRKKCTVEDNIREFLGKVFDAMNLEVEIIINKEDNITNKLIKNMLNCLKELEKKYPKNIEIIDKEE